MSNRFDENTTTDEVLAGVDLSGSRAFITGAASGIGLQTATALAASGADLAVAVRSDEQGDATVAAIRAEVPDADVACHHLDLSSLASARSCAASVVDDGRPIDLLINNAGVMFTDFGRTEDGFETQLGINHFGHFALTQGLRPALADGGRVVNLSSRGHTSAGIDWDDPNFERREYDKFLAYGQSKTANILFTIGLQERLADRSIDCFAVHPGVIRTNLSRHMDEDDFTELMRRAKASSMTGSDEGFAYKSVAAGAATSVYAATSAELTGHGGAYLSDCQITEAAAHAQDRADANRLWELSETLTRQS